MVSKITCWKCGYERFTNMPQLENSVHCPNCGINGNITMSNCIAVKLKNSSLRLFVPTN